MGQPFGWQAEEVLPALEEVGKKCRATTSSVSVVAILNAAQESLRARLAVLPGAPLNSLGVGEKEWAAWFTREPTGLRRILHHLRTNFAACAPGSAAWCENKQPVPAQSRALRLPVIPGASPADSLHAWLSFLSTQLNSAVPLLGLCPAGREWLDVIVGEPADADFVVLRTLPAATPVVSDIPYQLGATLSAEEVGVFANLARGELPAVSCLNGFNIAANRQAAAKSLANSRLGFFSRLLRSGTPF